MPFLDDLVAAVQAYPATMVSLTYSPPTPFVPAQAAQRINVNEVWSLKVRVHNHGLLNMTNVSLRIEGANGAGVSHFPVGPWDDPVDLTGVTARALGITETDDIYFRATAATPEGTELVRFHVTGFDVDLDFILTGQAPVPPHSPGVFSARVRP